MNGLPLHAALTLVCLACLPASAQQQPTGLPPGLDAQREQAWALVQRAEREDMRGLAARVLRDWLAVAPNDAGFRKAAGDTRHPLLRRWISTYTRGRVDGEPQPAAALALNREHRAWRDALVAALTEAAVNEIRPRRRAPLIDALRGLGVPVPSRVVELQPVTLEADALTLGWELRGSLPNWALAFRSGPYDLWLIDLDQDGQITLGTDGLALAGGRFVVQLPRQLLLPDGQCTLEVLENERLRLTPLDLGIPAWLQFEASALLELRLRAGVAPVLLETESSEAAALHLDYLALNRLANGESGLGIHDEDANLLGYSERAARAGKQSCLYPRIDSLSSALFDWYATAYHGIPLVSPTTLRVGVAYEHKLAALYPSQRSHVARPFMHPSATSRRVPTRFNARGEVPSPAPGTQYAIGCGYPVYVELPREHWPRAVEEVTLVGPEGPVPGYVSSPSQPAAPDVWPTNSGLLLFVPTQPLDYDTTYEARFALEGGPTWTWSFTTTDG